MFNIRNEDGPTHTTILATKMLVNDTISKTAIKYIFVCYLNGHPNFICGSESKYKIEIWIQIKYVGSATLLSTNLDNCLIYTVFYALIVINIIIPLLITS